MNGKRGRFIDAANSLTMQDPNGPARTDDGGHKFFTISGNWAQLNVASDPASLPGVFIAALDNLKRRKS